MEFAIGGFLDLGMTMDDDNHPALLEYTKNDHTNVSYD